MNIILMIGFFAVLIYAIALLACHTKTVKKSKWQTETLWEREAEVSFWRKRFEGTKEGRKVFSDLRRELKCKKDQTLCFRFDGEGSWTVHCAKINKNLKKLISSWEDAERDWS